MRLRSGSDIRREVDPEAERVSSCVAVGYCGEAVAFRAKEGGGLIVDREESLRLAGRLEPAHDRLCQVDEVGSGAYRVWMINVEAPSLKGYRFPRSVIAYAVV